MRSPWSLITLLAVAAAPLAAQAAPPAGLFGQFQQQCVAPQAKPGAVGAAAKGWARRGRRRRQGLDPGGAPFTRDGGGGRRPLRPDHRMVQTRA